MHFPKRLNITLGSTAAFDVETYLVETNEYAVARSTGGAIGVTWNRSDERPQGFPSTYKHQQWFMLPEPIARMVLAGADLFTGATQTAEDSNGREAQRQRALDDPSQGL